MLPLFGLEIFKPLEGKIKYAGKSHQCFHSLFGRFMYNTGKAIANFPVGGARHDERQAADVVNIILSWGIGIRLFILSMGVHVFYIIPGIICIQSQNEGGVIAFFPFG